MCLKVIKEEMIPIKVDAILATGVLLHEGVNSFSYWTKAAG